MTTTEGLSSEEIALLRAAETRMRAQAAELAKTADVSTPATLASSVGRRSDVPVVARPNWCGACGAKIEPNAIWCATCAHQVACDERAWRLRDARASIDPDGSMAWCRTDAEAYKAATAGARRIVGSLPEDERALPASVIGRGGWHRGVGNLVILGPTRIGKTCTIVAIGNKILDHARDGKLDAEALRMAIGLRLVSGLPLGRARDEHKRGMGRAPLELTAAMAPILLLDEVGYEGSKETTRDVVYERVLIASNRTLLTSGLTRAEFERTYGPPMLERLLERGALIDLHPRVAKAA